MSFIWTVPAALLLGLLFSSTWGVIALTLQEDPLIHLPNTVRYLGGALIIGAFIRIGGRMPGLSLKLFQSAMTLATLAYFFPTTMLFEGLKVVPSSGAALVFSAVPLWVLAIVHKEWQKQSFLLALSTLGILLFFFGAENERFDSMRNWIAMTSVVLSAICYTASLWISKRLLWIHNSDDLNFWSMLLAAGMHFGFAVTSVEPVFSIMNWNPGHWKTVLYLTLVLTGFGSLLYREIPVRLGEIGGRVISALVPLGGVLMGALYLKDTPINWQTLAGTACVAVAVILGLLNSNARRWLCLYINNDIRQGDRIRCVIDGFLKPANGSTTRVQIVDLSMGGIGFRSSQRFPIGDSVLVTLPIGPNWSQISIDCRIVHVHPSQEREQAWIGGLEFQNISSERRQLLVEFLARVAHTEREAA